MGKKIFSLLILVLLFAEVQTAWAAEYAIFNSATISRATGKPVVHHLDFESPFVDPMGKLNIISGDSSGANRVSSATVILNGKQIAGPNDFNNTISHVIRNIAVELNNTLSVEIDGTPGDSLRIEAVGTPPPPVIGTVNPLDQESINIPFVTVQGVVDTYANHISVSVNGQRTMVNGHSFFVNSLPMVPGENIISIEVVDSFRNQDQSEITVYYSQNENMEWIELELNDPAIFINMAIKLKVIPHLQNSVNQDSAMLTFDGPGEVVVSSVSLDEYSLKFDSPGFYTINYSINDIQGTLHSEKTMLNVIEPFTEDDWVDMHKATGELEEIYHTLLISSDIATVRQEVLEAARTNQAFSSVALSAGALCLVYKGFIPIILDLPNPNAAPTDGGGGSNKSNSTPISSPAFNQDHLTRLLETKKCRNCDLAGANLAGADLKDAYLPEANLKGANLQKANLKGAKFSRSNLESADLQEANLYRAYLRKANLQKANLQGAKMVSASFKEANLQGANLYKGKLNKARLQRANLQKADLRKADLSWAKLEGADLRGAKLQGSKMKHTFLNRALLDDEGRKYAEKNGAQFTMDTRIDSE